MSTKRLLYFNCIVISQSRQILAGLLFLFTIGIIFGSSPLHAETYNISKLRGGKVALLDTQSGKKTGTVITAADISKVAILGNAGNGKLLITFGGKEYHVKSFKLVTDMPVDISSKCQSVNATGYAATRGAASCTH